MALMQELLEEAADELDARLVARALEGPIDINKMSHTITLSVRNALVCKALIATVQSQVLKGKC